MFVASLLVVKAMAPVSYARHKAGDISVRVQGTKRDRLVRNSAVLPVTEVVEIDRERVKLKACHLPDFAGAYLWGGITAMPGDSLLPPGVRSPC